MLWKYGINLFLTVSKSPKINSTTEGSPLNHLYKSSKIKASPTANAINGNNGAIADHIAAPIETIAGIAAAVIAIAIAIKEAFKVANASDVVLVAGKGHEDYQILATETIHFDDREKVREIFG